MGRRLEEVEIDDKSYTPQEISAFILQKLKADAEAYLGTEINQAVITCRHALPMPNERQQKIRGASQDWRF